jgi:hypothetical protein
MNYRRHAVLGLLVAVLGLVACRPAPNSRATPAPAGATDGSATSAVLPAGYPVATYVPEAYPGQTNAPLKLTPVGAPDLPTPRLGQAVVGGQLYSFTMGMVVPGTLIYLTPAIGPEKRDVPPVIVGPDQAKGDILGQTDALGQFVLTGVPPGNYFLVVQIPLSWSLGQAAPDTETPLLIEVKENESHSAGIVYVSLP